MTTLRMAEITIDARDASRLARFWADALGWEVGPGASEYVATVTRADRPPDSLPMLFLQVPEEKSGKTRIHLDLTADDLDVEVSRLTELGAALLYERREWGVHWFTLKDPEGNEFCLGQPDASQPDASQSIASQSIASQSLAQSEAGQPG